MCSPQLFPAAGTGHTTDRPCGLSQRISPSLFMTCSFIRISFSRLICASVSTVASSFSASTALTRTERQCWAPNVDRTIAQLSQQPAQQALQRSPHGNLSLPAAEPEPRCSTVVVDWQRLFKDRRPKGYKEMKRPHRCYAEEEEARVHRAMNTALNNYA